MRDGGIHCRMRSRPRKPVIFDLVRRPITGRTLVVVAIFGVVANQFFW
jgi:hypothetical protein